MKCPDTTNNFTSPGTMFMLVPISMISVHYCLTVLLDYCMTVATTWKPQYCDVMVNVISLDSTGIRTKCQSQSIQVPGVAELWLMSPYFLHSFLTSGVNIPEPPVIKKYRYSSTYVRTMAVVHRTSYEPPPPQKSDHRPQIILQQADTHTPHTHNERGQLPKIRDLSPVWP